MKQELVLLMVSELSVHGYRGEEQRPLSRFLSLQSHILPLGPDLLFFSAASPAGSKVFNKGTFGEHLGTKSEHLSNLGMH